MIVCPKCNAQLDSQVPVCPNCGYLFPQIANQQQHAKGLWTLKMKIIATSIVAVCIVIIGAVVVNNTVIKNVSLNSESISLYGKTVEEAKEELNAKNISLKIDDCFYDDGSLLDKLDENSIISPKEVSSGSKNVKVKVYGGKKFSTKADVNNMVKVPNLYGMKKSKAISTLKEYGLNYEIETKTNDTFLGNVFYQDTKAGKKVKVGSTVTITVGKDFKKATTSDTEDDEYDVEWFLGNE